MRRICWWDGERFAGSGGSGRGNGEGRRERSRLRAVRIEECNGGKVIARLG